MEFLGYAPPLDPARVSHTEGPPPRATSDNDAAFGFSLERTNTLVLAQPAEQGPASE